MPMNEICRAVVDAANLAPSADNSTPWRYQVDDSSLSILPNGAATTELTRQRLDWISLGCALESARIRLSRFQLDADIELAEPSGRASARISWTRQRAASLDPLDAWLEARHSNRSLIFKGPAMALSQKESFESDCGQVPGSAMTWLDAPERRRAAVSLMQAAEQRRFAQRELHEELYSAIRFDVGWQQSCESGIAPGALGVLLPERFGFKALRHWPMQRFANLLGVHRVLGLRSAGLPGRWTPHLLAVGATTDHFHDCVAAGRLLQRLWTRAAMVGMAAQVMAASPLYALPGATWIDGNLQRQLAAGWRQLCEPTTPLVVLRIGHAEAPLIRTQRAPAQVTEQ